MPDSRRLDLARQGLNVALAVAQAAVPAITRPDVAAATEHEPRTPARPARGAFAIWGPIFAACLGYAAHQARPAVREDALLRRSGWLTAAAFAGNTAWQVVVPRRHLGAGQAIIGGISSSALAAYAQVARTDAERGLAGAERWLVGLPVGMLAGWTTAATAVSVGDTLARAGVAGAGRSRAVVADGLLAAVGVGSGAAVAAAGGGRRVPAAAFGAAALWALGGVAANRRDATCRTRIVAALAALPVIAGLLRGRAA